MQMFSFILMMVLIMNASGMAMEPGQSDGEMISSVVVPYLLIAGVIVVMSLLTRERYRREPSRGLRAIRRLDRITASGQWMTLGLFFFDVMILGFRDWLDDQLGRLVLVNDLIALALPMMVVAVAWASQYPIERKMRELGQIGSAESDESEPGRGLGLWGYLLSQFRHQILLMMLPLLLILTWMQVLEKLIPAGSRYAWLESWLLIAGAGGVFLFAPLLIRLTWDTVSMSPGPLRERLLAMCREHRVGVRDLLLWRTGSGMINGAVMGLIRPVRYILLTDGLVDRLPNDQIEAVMAHELGHVRRHHMLWMAICAFALLSTIGLLINGLIWLASLLILPEAMTVAHDQPLDMSSSADLLIVGSFVMVLAAWAPAFGYVSRRFERQADAFAVQHVAERLSDDGIITLEAADTMSKALQSVATLNHIPILRKNWRHGSIKWRVDHLYALVGTHVDACPIDRRVRLICAICLVLLLMTTMIWMAGDWLVPIF